MTRVVTGTFTELGNIHLSHGAAGKIRASGVRFGDRVRVTIEVIE